MALFGTAEWLEAYLAKLNGNAAYEEAGKTWEGAFVFVVEPEGNLDHVVRFYVDLWHGKAREGHAMTEDEEVDAPFIFTGKYSNWLKLLAGKLDPIKGLMTRKFKLKGDMKKVMRAVKAAKELVATIKMVETDLY